MFAERYELGASLGKGGMAEVFEAVAHGAHGFSRRVAIKRLLHELSEDPRSVRMFMDEARTASRLHFAKIVAVHDYGITSGRPFQVLELVEGWTAMHLIRLCFAKNEPMPADVALAIATEVAHALAYAHERTDEAGQPLGIVHRDVKPSNILVSTSGDIKLGDFGIALARERSAVTTGFVVRGTPGYISPEQLFGRPAGPTADVFATGLTLHALLTGASPLRLDNHNVLLAREEVPISKDLPPDVLAIVERAVRVKPEDRYPSARALARALGEALMARLETDPTTRIVQWLEELAPETPTPTRTVTSIIIPTGKQHRFETVTVDPRFTPGTKEPATKEARVTPPVGSAPPPNVGAGKETAPPRVSKRESPSSNRRALFALTAGAPLVLGAFALVLVSALRHEGATDPRPRADADATVDAFGPVASESASAAPPLVIPSASAARLQEKQDKPATRDFEVTVTSVASAVGARDALLDVFAASPAEVDRVVAAMTAVVRKCMLGRHVTRGAAVDLQISIERDGSYSSVKAFDRCHGAFCSRNQANWTPPDAIDCVTSSARTLRLPPLQSKYSSYQTESYFELR
jgi:serine/threonine protein kinase